MALDSIWHNKVRALLTMLGIIIGVAAVIILVSTMGGVTGQITSIFEEFGTNTITVTVTQRGTTRKISAEEMYDFREAHRALFNGVSPSVTMMGTIRTDSSDITGTVTGVSEEYQEIKKLNLKDGRFLSYVDVDKMMPVCVVGTYIEKELFGGENPVGKTLKINGFRYEVVGVLEETADSTAAGSDNVIYVPYTNSRSILKSDEVSSFVLSMYDENNADLCVDLIESFAERLLGDSDYVSCISMKQMMDSFNEIMDSMTLFLILIAGISLLVGGIGIMNIMLVSVSERTREIGIRKSLGAKDWDVLGQFVIEAGTISSIGGLLGIAFGSIFSLVIDKLTALTVTPDLGAILLSFGVSFAIGVTFGFLPAKKAAKLNPIDALRFD